MQSKTFRNQYYLLKDINTANIVIKKRNDVKFVSDTIDKLQEIRPLGFGNNFKMFINYTEHIKYL